MTAAASQSGLESGSERILTSACQFAADRSQATIVIESTNRDFPRAIEALKEMRVRTMAMGYAASSGVADPRLIDTSQNPYPVNSKGVSLEKVKGPEGVRLPAAHPDMQPASYRVSIRVTKKLV